MEERTLLSTFLVKNTADEGAGSLRQAILDSNSATGATNTIDFAILADGVQMIAPLSPLPPITNPVLIDGLSQPGYGGTPLIEISGSQTGSGDGLLITAPDVTIRDLDIDSFSQGAGIHLTGNDATADWIVGNFLGTDPTGTQPEPNDVGIEIDGGARSNLVGTDGDGLQDQDEGNLLSGNTFAGAWLEGQGTDDDVFAGNWIGTSVSGDASLPNGHREPFDYPHTFYGPGYYASRGGGVVIAGGASDNRIGGDGLDADSIAEINVISGNVNDGIELSGIGTDRNVIAGDMIGTDLTGTIALNNGQQGVEIDSGAANNTIGGTLAAARDVISNNGWDGVHILNSGTNGNIVEGDDIGVTSSGSGAAGNVAAGVAIYNGASDNTIGGTVPGSGNVISANLGSGVYISDFGTTSNLVDGDDIGTDVSGMLPLGNGLAGVIIQDGATNNTIGGASSTARDVVSANRVDGIDIAFGGTTGNVVEGDDIGVAVDGLGALGNAFSGVALYGGAGGNVIGGTAPGSGDVISANHTFGVYLSDAGTTSNVVEGNNIGTDSSGTLPLGNTYAGVIVQDGASDNTIGGTSPTARDVISANSTDGVDIAFSGTTGNVVEGDDIGVAADGAGPLGNTYSGVAIYGGASGNIIGGTAPGSGDVISANLGFGVYISDVGTTSNVVEGDEIGTDASGMLPLGNGYAGVIMQYSATNNTIGGISPAARDVISANGFNGVDIGFSGTTGNVVEGDYIGVTASGVGPLGNTYSGVAIYSGASGNLLGGTAPGSGNVITANTHEGVYISDVGTTGNVVQGDDIGTDASGMLTLGNYGAGIRILNGASDNTIGGTSPNARDIISANYGDGIDIAFNGTTNNVVEGDYIGGTGDAASQLYNLYSGVAIYGGASGNIIGGTAPRSGDVISDNNTFGVYISDVGTNGNVVEGNDIGTDASGTLPRGNAADGVIIQGGASGNTIGGTASGAGNVISANGGAGIRGNEQRYGVQITGYGTTGNVLGANRIGTDITGTIALVNVAAGVEIDGGAANNAIGGLTTGSGIYYGFNYASAITTADLTLQSEVSAPSGQDPDGSPAAVYRLDVETDSRLMVFVHAKGFTTRLILFDSRGQMRIASDGISASDPDDLIDEHLPAGTYSLEVMSTGGAGQAFLDAMLTPASSPFQPIGGTTSSEVNFYHPYVVATGDFNGDGIPDIASPDGVLLGMGDGTFRSSPVGLDLPEPGFVYITIVTGDFNGDGKLDIAVADFIELDVLLGNGDGTFQPPISYPTGNEPRSLVTGDFDGDGKLDLALGESYSESSTPSGVVVFLGNGDGTLRPPTEYSAGNEINDLVAGDFNNDGRTDLAFDGYDFQGGTYGYFANWLMLADLDGTFEPARENVLGDQYGGPMGVADFNGDGKLDLAFTSGDIIALGNGDGTFRSPIQITVEAGSAVVMGDFNGDGKIDEAIEDEGGNVDILLGNGDGTFQALKENPVENAPSESTYHNLAVADFNGDGRLDMVFADTIGTAAYDFGGLSILLGNGDGTFQAPQSNLTGLVPDSLAEGDFNNDGRLDMAVANRGSNDVSVLLGNGDGTFQPATDYSFGTVLHGYPYDVITVDFNGDGRLDLAVLNTRGLYILMGNGDGTFQPPQFEAQFYEIAGDPNPTLVTGDFNSDGRPDLAVSQYDGTEYDEITILLGTGDGSFQQPLESPVALKNIGSLVAGDFNHDGKLDLATEGSEPQTLFQGISVLLGNGDGTFQAALHLDTALESFEDGGLAAGDFNGDGRLDLATGGSEEQTPGTILQVFLGNGDGTFRPATSSTVEGIEAQDLVAGDFNQDGKLDLIVDGLDELNNGDRFTVFLGNGDGTFRSSPLLSGLSAPPLDGDFNGDGKPDLVTGGSESVSVLLGNGAGALVNASQLSTTTHSAPLMADFNGDGTDDVLVLDAAGIILYREGIPGSPGSFLPPLAINLGFPSRDIAVFTTNQGIVVASVDAQQDAVSLYTWSDGSFVRFRSLATGQLPTQVIAADFNDDGLSDLVVRNAGDGTLSVFFGTEVGGLVNPGSVPLDFLAPVALAVGSGVSDVEAVDTTGSGLLDLVVTNAMTGQVGVLRNRGQDTFAPLVPYRAGTGLSEIGISSGSTSVTSLEATAGVAAGRFTAGAPTGLVTINPGSYAIDVLAGLGGGRFADPVAIPTRNPAQVVRVADLNHDGVADLAVLTSDGVSIYLGNGTGGFAPPVIYGAGTDPSGLTVADLLGNGQLDLLVGNADGDVLILVGNGDGSFRPFEPVKAAIALAVADLTGDGVPDFVFADQSLNQVSVVYGSASQSSIGPQVIGNQATGVLAPGAVLLHDMNGDGIPDLIVANSGGNNVLVYPGLGNGQFGPSINGARGFAVGTDPTGLTVAELNGQDDLLVADTGSNDVSVLLGQGSGSSWTMISGPRIKTDAGPVAVAVGNLLGGTETDLAVANGGADNVQVFPGVGGGFFNDQPQATRTYAVGQAPSSLFLGDFNGLGPGLATLNAGSNNGTLISGIGSVNPVTQTFPTGGDSPTSGFAGDFTGDGFTDLVVGNNGDGHLALLLGGSGGLSLSQTLVSAEVPNPTSLSFAGVSDDLLNFYASTAGREAALNLAFNLEGGAGLETGSPSGGSGLGGGAGLEVGPFPVAVAPGGGSSLENALTQATSGSVEQVSQLLSLSGTTLDLAATLLTVSVMPGTFENESGGGAFATVGATGFGQPVSQARTNDGSGSSVEEPEDDERPPAVIDTIPAWEGLSIGLERAWGKVRAAILDREGALPATPDRNGSSRSSPGPSAPVPAQPSTETGAKPVSPTAPADPGKEDNTAAIDAALNDPDLLRPSETSADQPAGRSSDVLEGNDWTGWVMAPAGLAATAATGVAVARWVRHRRSASSGLR